MDNFPAYESWALENGWKQGLSIDRIDNNGPYSPGNCRWVDAVVQANNKGGNIPISVFGEDFPSLSSAWRKYGKYTYEFFYQQLKKGVPAEEALILTPNY
jgi:hypothetical protein